MFARLALLGILVSAGCSFDQERVARPTTPDPCVQSGGWSTGPEARWVRKIVRAGGYTVLAETGSALVVAGRGSEFYLWAGKAHDGRVDPAWRRLATVRGVPVYEMGDVWRHWRAHGFAFWVQGAGAPAAGRLAPLIDASLRVRWRDECHGVRRAP